VHLLLLKIFGVSGTPLQSLLYPHKVNGMVAEGKHPVKKYRAVKRRLAFALGGGGARGALQVGALRALLEASIRPDLLTGTSAGAVNAVFLAMHGFTPQSLDDLYAAWLAAAQADLFPANAAWLTLRVFFNRLHARPYQRLKDFFISQGATPDLRFGDLPHFPVILVSADLNSHQPVYYGNNPHEPVLEGLLASTALPPWVHPIETGGRFLIDGGAVSNLPIEPAITHGATEVIALNLSNPDEIDPDARGFGPFFAKLLTIVEIREVSLEMELARAKDVHVHVVTLKTEIPVPAWDFSHTDELIKRGYHITSQEIARWKPVRKRWWTGLFFHPN
jgi:NTE family protein